MRLMNYDELLAEIERVKEDIKKSNSLFHKRDQRKYLTKLLNEKNTYERYRSTKAKA